MSNSEDAFQAGCFFTGVVFILGIICYINNGGFVYDELKKAEETCKSSGSSLKEIYHDGDFKCENGAFFEEK